MRTDQRKLHSLIFLLIGLFLSLSLGLICFYWLGSSAKDSNIKYRVAGPSMAPKFLGKHYQLVCSRCGYPLVVDSMSLTQQSFVTCTNCGYQNNQLSGLSPQPGDLLSLSPLQKLPERFQTVAFQKDGNWVVKRVIGFPGEKITFDQGDLWIDQQRIEKTLSQFHQMAIPVYDHQFYSEAKPQIITTSKNSNWRLSPGEMKFDSNRNLSEEASKDPLILLNYACLPPPHLENKLSTPQDNYGYNASLSRPLFPVVDWIVSAKIIRFDLQRLEFHFHEAMNVYRIILDQQQGLLRLKKNETLLAESKLPDNFEQAFDLQLGYLDGRFLIELKKSESTLLVEHAVPVTQWNQRPISIHAFGNQLVMNKFIISRDLLLLSDRGLPENWEYDLTEEANSFFFLGDTCRFLKIRVSGDPRFQLINYLKQIR